MATPAELDAMRRAIVLSARALGATSPNPIVGCVILAADDTIVGEGWHHGAGLPHAEVNALAAAGPAAAGGTAVVTLEPCNHTGRTGPCTQALLAAGIVRVVFAVTDPNHRASGGAHTLRRAGLEVEGGVLETEAEAVNVAWITAMRLHRPYVRWKYAATLDGRVAAADHTSRWISSPESRADTHRLRAEADAVVIGSGTLLADDPHLAVRGLDAIHQPLRVVVDTRARICAGARILDGTASTLVAVGPDADTTHLPGVEVVRLPHAHTGIGLDIDTLLAVLFGRGVRSVLLEGGPTLAGAFIALGAVDAITGYLAPSLLGAGPVVLGDAGITTVAEACRFTLTDVVRIGPDLRISATATRETTSTSRTSPILTGQANQNDQRSITTLAAAEREH